ncbi:universal stress protein [Waterburya agarophytonicola K14]|uniref:Universal stress protein n=1 Tax=Waterburya agarophytonicola KI4 TaxID=2874699 RepID=A0A964FFH3_9CYAN|nr:universal stress protein [Waterburya agarophytonicola]MCC0177775.1 universal stress protein [Waterburya agarophytonicola KI4]
MLNKILVALDYSETSQTVFNSALSLAKTTGAELMIMHILGEDEPNYPVIPSYTYYPVLDDYDYNLYQKRYQDYKQEGIKFLQQKNKEAQAASIKSEFVQLTGNPGREICKLANTWSADIILVGSRGLKGLKEMFLGSVSNYVTHHAPCSVLIIRTSIENESEPTSSEEAETDRQSIPTN